VPFRWAWQNGASGWALEQLATHFNSLQVVNRPTNEVKSDQRRTTWLPPAAGYDCLHVTGSAHVLSTYELTVDDADRAAIASPSLPAAGGEPVVPCLASCRS
jgi:hypothetical protein